MRRRLTTVMVIMGVWLFGMLTMPVASQCEDGSKIMPSLYALIGMGVAGIFLMLLKSVVDGAGGIIVKGLVHKWKARPCDECPDHEAVKKGQHKAEITISQHDECLRWLMDSVKKIAREVGANDLTPEPTLPVPKVLTEFPSDGDQP